MLRILVSEGNQTVREQISSALKTQGYEVFEIDGGYETLRTFHADNKIDLIIMNTKLNAMSGIELCKIIRKLSEAPIIFISNNPSDDEELQCFDAGATDYVRSPLNIKILMHRVYIALTRILTKDNVIESKVFSFDGLIINNYAHEISIHEKIIPLTSKEYRVLFKLTSNLGRVFTREHLLDDIWGYDYVGTARSVDTLMARLRGKLGQWGERHVITVFGMGYKVE